MRKRGRVGQAMMHRELVGGNSHEGMLNTASAETEGDLAVGLKISMCATSGIWKKIHVVDDETRRLITKAL